MVIAAIMSAEVDSIDRVATRSESLVYSCPIQESPANAW